MELTSDQIAAIDMAKDEPVSILTGGPGTGKTTCCKEIVRWAYEKGNQKVALCAPSGKAAKKMSEAVGGFPAYTIHKLLGGHMESNHWVFYHRQENPLDYELVIVDEVSMVSNDLMARLLDAINPSSTRILFVGDQDQLPSIGAGAVLRDLLACGKIPHVELTKIHRNAGDIVQFCHQVKRGQAFKPYTVDNLCTLDDIRPKGTRNFVHVEHSDPAAILEVIVRITTEYVESLVEEPLWDCQVIAATNVKRDISCKAINEVLQEVLVAKPPEGQRFVEGDKCIQIKNEELPLASDEENTQVFNGDLCQISFVDGGCLHSDFFYPDRQCKIKTSDSNLLHAYAITCHRFQGSEAPVIVIPMHSQESWVTRKWIYTAMSRAEMLCVTVGQFKALRSAIFRQEQPRLTKHGKGLMND